MNQSIITTYLSATEAAAELGVSKATLYAYVSRGLIRSEEEHASRRRRYRAEDIRQLKLKKALRSNPAQVADSFLHWGEPVLETAISCIADNHLYYRGQDATMLAQRHPVEAVAAWLWMADKRADLFTGTLPLPQTVKALARRLPDGTGVYERIQILLPLLGTEDLAAFDTSPAGVCRTGARLLKCLTALASGSDQGGPDLVGQLQQGWLPGVPEARPLLQMALILCADHELNLSTFTARCVASSGATPYEAVAAGLAALKGHRHGGQCERVEAFLKEFPPGGPVRPTLRQWLARGEPLPGFGHRLYPGGDPRAKALLAQIQRLRPESLPLALVDPLCREVLESTGQFPTIDLALVMLTRVLDLPPGAPLTIFALGRTIGWIAHFIEQNQDPRLIRPRARYIGS